MAQGPFVSGLAFARIGQERRNESPPSRHPEQKAFDHEAQLLHLTLAKEQYFIN